MRIGKVIVSLLTVFALGLVPGCDDEGPTGLQDDAGKVVAFAGVIDGEPAMLVAVDFAGVVGRDGLVTVFVCDGTDVWQFFEGPVDGERAELVSQEGSTAGTAVVDLRLHDDHVQGDVTLGDGTRLSFDAAAAAGADGFYIGAIDVEGGLSGASRVGGTLRGTVTGDHVGETITGPDGTELNLEGTIRNYVAAEAPQLGGLRVAVYDGRAVGVSVRRGTLGFIEKIAF